MLRQGRAIAVFAVPHQMLARIETLQEGSRGQASVIPLIAHRLDGFLVHH